eukprot:6151410-Amphidinium_carterae.1
MNACPDWACSVKIGAYARMPRCYGCVSLIKELAQPKLATMSNERDQIIFLLWDEGVQATCSRRSYLEIVPSVRCSRGRIGDSVVIEAGCASVHTTASS